MKGCISVIIPVYNVADYLQECLDSVITQNYTDLEIILIDDGSTDASGKICDEYARKDKRIQVIHQKNSGAAAAKNAGLRTASGEFLSFVDSDDYLEPGAYAYMLDLLEKSRADVAQCCYRNVYMNCSEPAYNPYGSKSYDVQEYLLFYLDGFLCSLLWNKLYRRTLFDGIFFEEGHVIDDEYFTYQGMMNAKKIIIDDRIIYNYRIRRSSVMHQEQKENRKLLDRIDYLNKRRINIGNRYNRLKKRFDKEYIFDLINLSKEASHTADSMKVIQTEIKQYFKEGNYTIPGIHYIPAVLKLYFSSTEFLLKHTKEPVREEHGYILFP